MEDIDKVSTTDETTNTYKEQTTESYQEELKLYEDFFQNISHRASTHHQITVNNLEEIKERLEKLKENSKQIKNELFYHEEYAIVDRQKTILDTEIKVQEQNQAFLDYHFSDKDELHESIDYFNKAIFQTNATFFENYNHSYLSTILEQEKFFDFFKNSTTSFDETLGKYQEAILSLFNKLDTEIKQMDDSVSEIIKKKNRSISLNHHFFQDQMMNFLDNQLLFSVQEDPTSIDIQAIVSDKIQQFEAFQSYVLEEDAKLVHYLKEDYLELYQKILERRLMNQSNHLTDTLDFFNHPERSIQEYKDKILTYHRTRDKKELKKTIQTYESVKHYDSIKKKMENQTKKMLSRIFKERVTLLLEYRLETYDVLSTFNETLHLYQALMNEDTFLAQIIGDQTSKIIKDKINHLSILEFNKEMKTNINFDIDSIKIKNRINQLELDMSYAVKKHIVNQEQDLLKVLLDTYHFVLTHQANFIHAKYNIKKDALQMKKIEDAVNAHFAYLHQSSNLTREMEARFIQRAIKMIRSNETHNIKVAEAVSKLKLKLREFDIKKIHFQTMMENEMAYIVSQASRVSEETKINHDFILTTYENQIRFAKEAIELADSEYNLRVEAIQNAIDEEQNFLEDFIRNESRKYENQIEQEKNDYQAALYKNQHLLSEATDKRVAKILSKEEKQLTLHHQEFLKKVQNSVYENENIEAAKRRINELLEDYDDAMKDAKELRTETIFEMQKLYEESKVRYETLKPFLENKLNVLDPNFYYQIERINQRYSYKLKLAEASLEESTDALLADYKDIYFENANQEMHVDFTDILTTLNTKRDENQKTYETSLQKIEDGYHIAIEKLEIEEQSKLSSLDQMKKDQNLNVKARLNQLTTEENEVDRNYQSKLSSLHQSLDNQISSYTKEYNQTLSNNEKYIESLSSSFDSVLSSYQPYIKKQLRNPEIKKIFKENKKVFKEQKKRMQKEIVLSTKEIKFN